MMEAMMVDDYGSKVPRVKSGNDGKGSVGKKRKEGGPRRF